MTPGLGHGQGRCQVDSTDAVCSDCDQQIFRIGEFSTAFLGYGSSSANEAKCQIGNAIVPNVSVISELSGGGV